jgi:excinuclease ABC subunit C
MEFEKAARYRDISANLEAVFGRKNRKFENPALPDPDPGMTAVKALAERLGLAKLPRHIIGFDISNILGQLAVASMVVMKDGKPDRSSYRRFRIKTVMQSDDFAMMKEVIQRHFTRLMEENIPFPDLVMVDGGKGQLSSAIAGLIEINAPPLPILGLAEKNEEIYLPGQSAPVVLSRHDPALRMLQALRDEAHRFAITFHRALRHREIERSLLDDIPGIGAKRKVELLRTFGSVSALRKSTPEEIAERIPGLGLHLAEKIYDTLTAARRKIRSSGEKNNNEE